MRWLRRFVEIALSFLLFPIALFFFGALAFAVWEGVLAYLGAILAAWLLFAFALPLLTGVMSAGELVANVRSRRRSERYYEGEPLPDRRFPELGRKRDSARRKPGDFE